MDERQAQRGRQLLDLCWPYEFDGVFDVNRHYFGDAVEQMRRVHSEVTFEPDRNIAVWLRQLGEHTRNLEALAATFCNAPDLSVFTYFSNQKYAIGHGGKLPTWAADRICLVSLLTRATLLPNSDPTDEKIHSLLEQVDGTRAGDLSDPILIALKRAVDGVSLGLTTLEHIYLSIENELQAH